MSSVTDLLKVDLVSASDKKVRLIWVQAVPVKNEDIGLFRNKLDNFIKYCSSGKIYKDSPEYKGLMPEVEVCFWDEVDGAIVDVLLEKQSSAAELGVAVVWRESAGDGLL